MEKILFVCVENSCRSQIAEGLANNLGVGRVKAYSAGSRPGVMVNPLAIEVMKEINIEISFAKPKGFAALPTRKFDYVVTLGCGDVCPFVPAQEHLHWEIVDPKGKSVEFFRKTRDEIRLKIESLLKTPKPRKKEEVAHEKAF